MSEATSKSSSYDEIDRKIDVALDRAGAVFGFWIRILLLLGLVSGLAWVIFYSRFAPTLTPLFLSFTGQLVQVLLIIVLLLVTLLVVLRSFERRRVYWLMPGESGVSLQDYKGNPGALDLASKVVAVLRGVKRSPGLGDEMQRGLLLVGSPGSGRSYLAQCIAAEANVPFAYTSARSLQRGWVGFGNGTEMIYERARRLARKHGGCIVFIDDLSALQSSLGAGTGRIASLAGTRSSPLDEVLLQIHPRVRDDGWRSRLWRAMGLPSWQKNPPAVLTVGSTDLLQALDPAIAASGRFDWCIRIDVPDHEGRKELIAHYLGQAARSPQPLLDRLASDTMGLTPGAIRSIVNQAVIVARSDGRDAAEYRDFVLAMDLYEMRLGQSTLATTWDQRRRIAYRQAGHVIAQIKLMPSVRIPPLSITRHRRPVDAWDVSVDEMGGYSVAELLAAIEVSLAGKGAERVYLGGELSGATDELKLATQIAGAFVGHYGMTGSLYYAGAFGEAPDARLKPEIERVLDEQFEKAKQLLTEYREAADEIVDALLDRGDLSGDEGIAIVRAFEERRFGAPSAETTSERTEERALAVGLYLAPSSGWRDALGPAH